MVVPVVQAIPGCPAVTIVSTVRSGKFELIMAFRDWAPRPICTSTLLARSSAVARRNTRAESPASHVRARAKIPELTGRVLSCWRTDTVDLH